MIQPPVQIPTESIPLDDSMIEETQQATQSTQHASQPNPANTNSHLWGYLQPCNNLLRRLDLWKVQPAVSVGRAPDNNIVLPGGKVSNKHCRITWDGREDKNSAVTVLDTSSNGTWINGVKIGRDKTAVLKEGNEIAFGSPHPQPGELEDYRFIYRHTAAGSPRGGLHAQYDISHEIGKGSFATVMKAVSRATGQWYAIKVIQDHKVKRATANSNETAFAREISILERLHHRNICQMKEAFFEDNSINLVLEFVDGGDLLDYILKENGLKEPMAVHIIAQVCDALAYIHSKGIAHRDLKPENVLLTTDNPPIVKVADFGLAKVVDSVTFLRTMCGTPAYLAPEVVTQQNQEGYDHLVDSWSVGVIVFCMFTLSSPFIEDENQRDIKVRIAGRTIQWSTLDNIDVSPQARNFIEMLLEHDPRDRMSLSTACTHPWLADVPTLSHLQHRSITDSSVASIQDGSSSISLLDSEDTEMTDGSSEPAVSEGFDKLHLRQQSARAPLQQRAQEVAQAAENDQRLMEPNWQMVQHAQEIANSVRNGKRKLDPQNPLPEMDVENGKPKKSKRVPEANGPTTRTRAAKGRSRGGASSPLARLQEAAVGMIVEEEHLEDDEDAEEAAGAAFHAPPRKSTRVSPKKGTRRG
ncbi:kinase-like domain-containing protein [Suillus bovinus]|uniref:kinase-like domain-containing protein n=1 Tax=Suillus bovinus TaxID=48563 RepID=UPI001B86B52C|nr:kinase-like domain-containing protein [Suillus bovinus]KAG2154460.1 kinase-like domain-containing protein [Suillus bovinus]